jgi:hypothetical protein
MPDSIDSHIACDARPDFRGTRHRGGRGSIIRDRGSKALRFVEITQDLTARGNAARVACFWRSSLEIFPLTRAGGADFHSFADSFSRRILAMGECQ